MRLLNSSMQEELISVIVPIYNVEKYLNRCVDSIIKQSYTNLEIILVEDGSPDSCYLLCDQLAEKDRRIKVIHQENKGLSGARNAGLDIATGDYIVFIDSDDFVQDNFVEKLYTGLIRNNVDICQCGIQNVADELDVHYETKNKWKVKTGKEVLLELYGPRHLEYTVVWNKLYKKKVIGDLRFPIGKIHEDEYFTYLIYDRAEEMAVVDAKLYYYYVDNNSITRSKYSLRRQDIIQAYKERLQYFKEKGYLDLYYKTGEFMADILIYHGYCTEVFLNDQGRKMQIWGDFRQLYYEQHKFKNAPVVKRMYLRLYYRFPKIFEIMFRLYQSRKRK